MVGRGRDATDDLRGNRSGLEASPSILELHAIHSVGHRPKLQIYLGIASVCYACLFSLPCVNRTDFEKCSRDPLGVFSPWQMRLEKPLKPSCGEMMQEWVGKK